MRENRRKIENVIEPPPPPPPITIHPPSLQLYQFLQFSFFFGEIDCNGHETQTLSVTAIYNYVLLNLGIL